MTIESIPLNTKGNLITVNGLQILEHQWQSIIFYAEQMHEGGCLDEEHGDAVAEIMNHLYQVQEQGCIDPVIVTLFEIYSEEAIEALVKFGESRDWNFNKHNLD
ncbi:hypothetical protein [Neptuniibacter sp. QD37_11]|uniref:hypothetical protein n=1 Tax=Neptuniibacter sp. QD37_11 TaxID=3398209 RepID=UPI0039F61D06